jgi:hypothetical protein
VKQGILALDTQKGIRTRRDISTDSETDWAGFEKAACCFVLLVVAFWGFSITEKKV